MLLRQKRTAHSIPARLAMIQKMVTGIALYRLDG